MNPESFTVETSISAAYQANRDVRKAREALDIAKAVQDATRDLCMGFEDEVATLRRRIAELEQQAADHEQADVNDRMSEPESIPVAELAEVLGCEADAGAVRSRVQWFAGYERAGSDIEGWRRLCRAVRLDGGEASPEEVAEAVEAIARELESAKKALESPLSPDSTSQ